MGCGASSPPAATPKPASSDTTAVPQDRPEAEVSATVRQAQQAPANGGNENDGKPAGEGNDALVDKVAAETVADYKGKGLSDFPSDVDPVTTELDISENPGIKQLEGISVLASLKKLDANSCTGLTALPSEIGACKKLEEVLAFACKIKDIPKEIGELEELTTLNLFNNVIKKLPNEVGNLPKLEEVNLAGNKLMIVGDPVFASWATVKILQLYDNNIVRLGSLAPLTALEELRVSGNNLEEMPTLGPSHQNLTIFECQKNRVATIADDYFGATPALQRLNIFSNFVKKLPPSLWSCKELIAVQAQDCKLDELLVEQCPSALEVIFLQGNTNLTTLPSSLATCSTLKRVNLTGLILDEPGMEMHLSIKKTCLGYSDGLFWDIDGEKIIGEAV